MASRIIVKNLPKDTTKDKLVQHIQKNCPTTVVTDCNLKYTPDGVFRKFAYVGFDAPEQATLVQKKLNGTFIRTTKIQVEMAVDFGDKSIKPWSKHSQKQKSIPKTESVQKANEKGTNKVTEESKPTKPGFVIKMKGLSGFYTEKTVQEFFKPIKLKSIRVPRNAQKKPIGVAFVELGSEKELEQAMGRNKNFLNGKKIFLKKSTEEVGPEKKVIAPPPWELKAKESNLQEVETIADSGRLFVRNLWFGVTEQELEEVFGKFGPLAEVTLPVDPLTKKVKGFAHVVFVFPEHALKAFTELDYTTLHGRLMHILPGREVKEEDESNEKSSYKKKKDKKLKSNSSSTHNWNTLFLGANAVADTMAKTYNTDKSNILDDDTKGSLGVRLALGETQIVSETREFLISNGVALDSFSQAAGERSKTVILVKNLPSSVTADELRDIFNKHGTVNRVVMPPSGITAIVEYLEPSEARQGFMKLNFSKFRSIPLYLEWAPMGIFIHPSTKRKPDETPVQGEEMDTKIEEEDKDIKEEATKEEVNLIPNDFKCIA